MADRATIPSNSTGLFSTRHSDPKALPVGAVWAEKEPNSYDTFGSEQKKVKRQPINSSRQNKKGTVVGSTASVNFETDLTATNMRTDIEAFLFANTRNKGVFVTASIAADGYVIAEGGETYRAGDLLFADGITAAANIGLRVLAANGTDTKVPAAGLTADANGKIRISKVGHQFAVGDLSVDTTGDFPVLESAAFDLTLLGLVPGEVIFVGGDAVGTTFAQAANKGWARVKSIAAGGITLDVTDVEFVADTGVGKTIRIFFGNVVKNEADQTLQKDIYTAFRRQVGIPDRDTGIIQSEVILGNIASKITFDVPEEDKITVATEYMGRRKINFADDAEVDETGTFLSVNEEDAINSTKDSRRLRMGIYPDRASPTSVPVLLVPAFTEASISVDNNISENKAITYVGAYAHTPGFFDAMVTGTGYFVRIDVLDATEEDADVFFMFSTYKKNRGISWSMPMMSVSTEGLSVEINEPIMVELEGEAATGKKYDLGMDHTLLMVFYDYLPEAAAD